MLSCDARVCEKSYIRASARRNLAIERKGKPVERRGRKVTGLEQWLQGSGTADIANSLLAWLCFPPLAPPSLVSLL
jgi:hypothetical protein